MPVTAKTSFCKLPYGVLQQIHKTCFETRYSPFKCSLSTYTLQVMGAKQVLDNFPRQKRKAWYRLHLRVAECTHFLSMQQYAMRHIIIFPYKNIFVTAVYFYGEEKLFLPTQSNMILPTPILYFLGSIISHHQ